ncbi:hypothetical protein CC79DRAFT_1336679, partial [Sarocladium strictum]
MNRLQSTFFCRAAAAAAAAAAAIIAALRVSPPATNLVLSSIGRLAEMQSVPNITMTRARPLLNRSMCCRWQLQADNKRLSMESICNSLISY